MTNPQTSSLKLILKPQETLQLGIPWPVWGAYNSEIYGTLLGKDPDELERLKEAGII